MLNSRLMQLAFRAKNSIKLYRTYQNPSSLRLFSYSNKRFFSTNNEQEDSKESKKESTEIPKDMNKDNENQDKSGEKTQDSRKIYIFIFRI